MKETRMDGPGSASWIPMRMCHMRLMSINPLIQSFLYPGNDVARLNEAQSTWKRRRGRLTHFEGFPLQLSLKESWHNWATVTATDCCDSWGVNTKSAHAHAHSLRSIQIFHLKGQFIKKITLFTHPHMVSNTNTFYFTVIIILYNLPL